MDQKHTNKKILVRGIKYMAVTVPLLFLAPYLLTLSFLNKDNFTFYIFLAVGILAGAGAIYCGFKGINTILKSLFK